MCWVHGLGAGASSWDSVGLQFRDARLGNLMQLTLVTVVLSIRDLHLSNCRDSRPSRFRPIVLSISEGSQPGALTFVNAQTRDQAVLRTQGFRVGISVLSNQRPYGRVYCSVWP